MRTTTKILFYTLVGLALALYIQRLIYVSNLTQKPPIIKGKIEECCCDAEHLKDVNDKIVDIAEDLSKTLFFKIFRVNIHKDCPFWVQQTLCTSPLGKCSICPCDENEIPLPWKQEKTNYIMNLQTDVFYKWEPTADRQLEWHVEEKDSEKGIYVDLKRNAEVFTGYQGQRIWSAIYGENCFKGTLQDMCIEERLLNRIISGLHTSISTQLSEYYNDEYNRTYANYDIFFTKVGEFPDRIANLYFAHSVLLRAINRAHEQIRNYNFTTGNFLEDVQTKTLIDKLYDYTLQNCDNPFDEKILFANLNRGEINKRFISYFHNISRIMDCVECETCKVYGKLQTLGIASALKILFSEKFTGKSQIFLTRNEITALFVTFYKFSTSISYIDKMFERRYNRERGIFLDLSIAFVVFVVMVTVFKKMVDDKTKKLTNQIRTSFNRYDELTNDAKAKAKAKKHQQQ